MKTGCCLLLLATPDDPLARRAVPLAGQSGYDYAEVSLARLLLLDARETAAYRKFPEMVEINDHTDIPTPAGIRCALRIREGGNKAVFLPTANCSMKPACLPRCLTTRSPKEWR